MSTDSDLRRNRHGGGLRLRATRRQFVCGMALAGLAAATTALAEEAGVTVTEAVADTDGEVVGDVSAAADGQASSDQQPAEGQGPAEEQSPETPEVHAYCDGDLLIVVVDGLKSAAVVRVQARVGAGLNRDLAWQTWPEAAFSGVVTDDGPCAVMEVPVEGDGTWQLPGIRANQATRVSLARDGAALAEAPQEDLDDIAAMTPEVTAAAGSNVTLAIGNRLDYGGTGWNIGTDAWLTWDFLVSDDKGKNWHGTCAVPALSCPDAGTYRLVDPSQYTSRWPQIVLYMFYGPGGPGYDRALAAGVWPKRTWDDDPKTAALVSSGDWWTLHQIYLHLLVSDTFSSSLSEATYLMTEGQVDWVRWNIIGLNSAGEVINTDCTQYKLTDAWDDPDFPGWADGDFNTGKIVGFECNLLYTGGSTQPVVYAGYYQAPAKKGKVRLTKTSANTAITNGNSCYSLKGAVYGVYSDKGCTKRVASLTTDDKGAATSQELDAGTYWLKETSAPMSFLLDTTVKSVTAPAGGTGEVTFADQPATDPIVAIAYKLDADVKKATPQGGATLAGAEFTVRFYAGWYQNVSELPKSPTRQWVFKTGADGAAVPDKAHLVKGDAFYTNNSGKFSLPSGTVTVQETKAPAGYTIADAYKSPALQRVAVGEGLNAVRSYNVPNVMEPVQRGGLSIQKCDADTGQTTPQGWATFAGAVFTVRNRNEAAVVVGGKSYAPGADICTLAVDSSGFVQTAKDALPLGTYGVEETTAPTKGYLATEGEHLVTIATPNALTPVTHK